MGLKHGINVTSRSERVVGQRHGCATDDVDIRDDAAACEAVTEPTEASWMAPRHSE
jgi:hypothetical protein